MKTVASVFSWLGGIATAIILWVSFIPLFTYGAYFWIPLIYSVFDLIILIWRQSATSNGKKVGCGVCTLLFCSLVGGILTLCIPENQLY